MLNRSLLYCNNYDISNEGGIEIILKLLESGHSVELPATGYSMFPTIRPEDKVLVKPIDKTSVPEPGSILVVNLDSRLIMHRLIKIRIDPPCSNLLITRGDCMVEPDLPFQPDKIIGLAYSYKRKSRQKVIICRILSDKEYKINRLWLRLWIRMRKVLLKEGASSRVEVQKLNDEE